jgi:glycosyltransferase involved in cell wall biosynthesis
MENRKILISINTSWNIYNFRRNLLVHLKNEGFEIHVAAPTDAYSDKLKNLGFYFHSLKMDKKGSNPLADYRLYRDYRKLISKIRPHISLFYTIKPNIYGTLAATESNVPVLNNISGLGTVFLRKSLSSLIAKSLYKIALKKSSLVFFQNEDDRQLFIRKKLIKSENSALIPGSGIDIEYFKPIAKERMNAKLRFLMVSRLIYDKGVLEYLKAAEIVREKYDVEFELLGRPENEANLGLSENSIREFAKKGIVNWTNELEDVRESISDADIIVLPSYREGLSRALLEACSMAKAIITTDVPGCRELVDQGRNGFLCKAKDPQSLANAMTKAIEMRREKLIEMGQIGRELVKTQYNEKLIFRAYQNAIANNLK